MGTLAEKFALDCCPSSAFVSAQYGFLPEEESGDVQPVHCPRHAHAAAKGEGGGSDKEQHSRRVEGEYGQKRLGENREDGREKEYDQRIASYKEG